MTSPKFSWKSGPEQVNSCLAVRGKVEIGCCLAGKKRLNRCEHFAPNSLPASRWRQREEVERSNGRGLHFFRAYASFAEGHGNTNGFDRRTPIDQDI